MLIGVMQTEIQQKLQPERNIGFLLVVLMQIGASVASSCAVWLLVVLLVAITYSTLSPTRTLVAVGFVQYYKLKNKHDKLIGTGYFSLTSIMSKIVDIF